MKKKFLRPLIILLLLVLGFLYIVKNPELRISQKLFSNHGISVEDAYKLCNKTGCVSTPVTIDAFMIGSSGVGVLTDAKKTNGYVQAGQTISLIPDENMNLVEMYNFLNRDGYFLGNGILKIQVKGTLKYTPVSRDTLEDHITLYFTIKDLKIISQNGCLENGIAYELGVCFIQKQYSIDVNTAYDKLINSNLYKNALQESKSRDLIEMKYDDNMKTWIFNISQQNTPAPGCCRDQFEVNQEKVFYKRICKVNTNAAKYGYADACADYYKNAFVQEETFGIQSGGTNLSATGTETIDSVENFPLTNMTIGKNILQNLGKTVNAGMYTITLIEGSTKDQLEVVNNDGGEKRYIDLLYDKTCEGGDTGPCGKFSEFKYTSDRYVFFRYVAYNEGGLGVLDLAYLKTILLFGISDDTIFDSTKNGDQFFIGNSQSFDPEFRITYKNDISKYKSIGVFKVYGYYDDGSYLYLQTDDGEYQSTERLLRKINLNTLEDENEITVPCDETDNQYYASGGFGKPVIYLYPTQPTDVYVQLDCKEKFSFTYPQFDPKIGGWEVNALPDGTLINKKDNKEYSYIFRETDTANIKKITQGFIIENKDITSFLQEKLSYLGLTAREYNEFIVYRLPRMQKYPYVKVYFAGSDYTDQAKLTITPKPDSIQRVFMVFEGIQTPIKLPQQSLTKFERSGFSVIERGGTEIINK